MTNTFDKNNVNKSIVNKNIVNKNIVNKNIVLCGVGGQGTVLASKLIAGETVATTETIDNGAKEVAVVRCDVQPVTRDNLVEVWFDGGIYDAANYTNYEGMSDAVKPANYNG